MPIGLAKAIAVRLQWDDGFGTLLWHWAGLLEEENGGPDDGGDGEADKHRCRTQVLGQARERMPFQVDAVYGGLDGSVECFYQENLQQADNEGAALQCSDVEREAGGTQDGQEKQFLTECRLVAYEPQ